MTGRLQYLHSVLILRIGGKVTKVACKGLHLSVEQVLLHLHPVPRSCQTRDLIQVGVLRHKVGHIVADLLSSLKGLESVQTAAHLLEVKHLLLLIFWAAPWGGKEDCVCFEAWHHFKVVANYEFNAVLYLIDFSIVSCQLNLSGVNVNGNDPFTGESELDGIASHATESVHKNISTAAICNVLGNLLRRDGIPRFRVQLDALIKLGEKPVPLCPVLVYVRKVRQF